MPRRTDEGESGRGGEGEASDADKSPCLPVSPSPRLIARTGDRADAAGEVVHFADAIGMQPVREENDVQIQAPDRSTSRCR